MEQAIKPIETHYKGYRFRSRLEARWAVFFDAIGAEWEYEPEGFVLEDGTYYLTDFHLRNVAGRGEEFESGLWIEVKGNMHDDDKHKIELFGLHDVNYDTLEHKGHRLYVVGRIPEGNCMQDRIDYMWKCAYDKNSIFNLYTVDGDYFTGVLGIGYDGKPVLNDENDNIGMDWDKTNQAYMVAQQARFEHGETPQIRR
jgi:hypothetical protein